MRVLKVAIDFLAPRAAAFCPAILPSRFATRSCRPFSFAILPTPTDMTTFSTLGTCMGFCHLNSPLSVSNAFFFFFFFKLAFFFLVSREKCRTASHLFFVSADLHHLAYLYSMLFL